MAWIPCQCCGKEFLSANPWFVCDVCGNRVCPFACPTIEENIVWETSSIGRKEEINERKEFVIQQIRVCNGLQRFAADMAFEGKYYRPATRHEYVDSYRRT